jgi:hypothetical protein
VYALNAASGAVIWKYKAVGPVESGIVLKRGSSVADEELFFGSDDGYVCVLSLLHTWPLLCFALEFLATGMRLMLPTAQSTGSFTREQP